MHGDRWRSFPEDRPRPLARSPSMISYSSHSRGGEDLGASMGSFGRQRLNANRRTEAENNRTAAPPDIPTTVPMIHSGLQASSAAGSNHSAAPGHRQTDHAERHRTVPDVRLLPPAEQQCLDLFRSLAPLRVRHRVPPDLNAHGLWLLNRPWFSFCSVFGVRGCSSILVGPVRVAGRGRGGPGQHVREERNHVHLAVLLSRRRDVRADDVGEPLLEPLADQVGQVAERQPLGRRLVSFSQNPQQLAREHGVPQPLGRQRRVAVAGRAQQRDPAGRKRMPRLLDGHVARPRRQERLECRPGETGIEDQVTAQVPTAALMFFASASMRMLVPSRSGSRVLQIGR